MSNRSAQDNGWLLMIAQLPTEEPAVRMRVLRTLESLGAANMREGVFVLPVTPANRQALEHMAAYIARNAGTSHVFQTVEGDAAQEAAIQRLFDRSHRYADLVKTVESLKLGFGVSDPGALSRVLHKQQREFDAISALDFFPSDAQARARRALDEAAADIRRLVFPTRTQDAALAGTNLQGRLWATRRPLWADRLASAWLIRRFIDPGATVYWMDPVQPCPPDALGFAFDGAHFGNTENRVTFEELTRHAGLHRDPALAKIGSIVRFLEVRDTPVPEAAGVETLLQGAVRRAANDKLLHAEAENTIDLLYEAQ